MLRIGSIVAAILALCLLFTNNTNAQNATLKQFITAVDCDHMTVETGSGMVNNVDCPYFPPVVERVLVKKSSITVTGIYDAVHMTRLRVAFRGVWYEYGVDAELTTNGNAWQIVLIGDAIDIEPGDYNIIVQSTDENGVTQQDSGTVVVPVVPDPIDPDSSSGGTGTPKPSRPSVLIPGVPNTGEAGMSISALALLVFVLPLLIHWRKKRPS